MTTHRLSEAPRSEASSELSPHESRDQCTLFSGSAARLGDLSSPLQKSLLLIVELSPHEAIRRLNEPHLALLVIKSYSMLVANRVASTYVK